MENSKLEKGRKEGIPDHKTLFSVVFCSKKPEKAWVVVFKSSR